MAKKSSTLAPRIDAIRLPELIEGDSERLDAHDNYEGERFTTIDLSGRDLAGSTFTECEFLSVTANEANLRTAAFVDTRFERMNAPIFSAPRSRFRDVEIDSSRLGSAELYEASWQSVHLINCKLGFVNLRGAALQDVLFTNCSIDELDLGGAKATRVSFVDTQINNLDLTRATLKNVDVRGLQMRQITGLEGLRGATLNSFQIAELAPLFAAQIGIIIED